jgi:UDP-MurNAc hydroxylase
MTVRPGPLQAQGAVEPPIGGSANALRTTVIGHAGLFIEGAGVTLLVDPWFAGSCYWRSWWHFPPSPEPDESWLDPDYLYLSHHHFDHFHYPSLRRLSRSIRVLIPRFGNDMMPRELASLGFEHVTEMPHAQTVVLGTGFEVTSFQYGFDDSALVVSDNHSVVVDLNDCKLRPKELANLRARFGRPDLMLKSHSWAQGYPNCYSADDEADLEVLSKSDYVRDFIEATLALEPHGAVPFASMVCFLHPDSWERNADVVTPEDVAGDFRAAAVSGTELLLMKPGDTWIKNQPFAEELGDYYSNRQWWLEKLRSERGPEIERSLAEEAARDLPSSKLASYFSAFVRSIPRAVTLALRRPVVVTLADDERCCVVDWRRRRAVVGLSIPAEHASVIEVSPGLLAAAIDGRIVHFLHISMRFRGRIRKGGLSTEFAFWTLMALWEMGYLPLRRLANRRFVSVCWQRRTEIMGVANAAVRGRGSMAARMTSRFMSGEDRPASE